MNDLSVYITLIKLSLGLGILATPYAYSKFGLPASFIGYLILGALNLYTMLLLSRSCKEVGSHNARNISELAYLIFG